MSSPLLLLLLARLSLSAALPAAWLPGDYENTTEDALRFLSDHNSTAEQVYSYAVSAYWTYNTNLTDYNAELQTNASLLVDEFAEAWASKAKSSFPAELIDSLPERNDRRRLYGTMVLGTANLPQEERQEINSLYTKIGRVYSTAKVHPEPNVTWTLSPDLLQIMAKSRNYEELLYAWKSWRDVAGAPIKEMYSRYVELNNKGIRADGFNDVGAYRRSWYGTKTFERDLEKLYKAIEPLYVQLHAYVRRHLHKLYGSEFINLEGPIPAHLLGNMWSQVWGSIYDLVVPYPGKTNMDVTSEMIKQGYNVTHMFRMAEEFFTSLGLSEMPPEFWEGSMLVKPDDREVVCHASAWDFYNRKDFRIKMCTKVTMQDFFTVHHEMGHIQYDLQYKDQPVGLRGGANPGFHEAIGDVIFLSVSTPKHLHAIHLLESEETDPESDLNYLLWMALDKIALLPSAYLIDLWVWGVYSGSTPPEKYNSDWWHLRTKYQGICPPVKRTEDDFDPGAKYHIANDVPYIRYFISFILQFQIHEKLCEAANHTGPLHTCDIYGSTEAGAILKEILKSGASKPWPDLLQETVGTSEITADALMRYFEPLTRWLEKQNVDETLGWPDYMWMPPDPRDDDDDDDEKDGYDRE